MGLFSISHHTIDTIDWNGGNSSMQSLSLGCPVVTRPSTFMRGRHTVSMLEMLDLPELIARDDDDYVDISVRLLADEEFYNDMKQKIMDRKQRLFSDQEVSLAFKKAIETLCFRSP
jgi:predicted O-linked N-acetylglucosamine transferase (SPINDLY family)